MIDEIVCWECGGVFYDWDEADKHECKRRVFKIADGDPLPHEDPETSREARYWPADRASR